MSVPCFSEIQFLLNLRASRCLRIETMASATRLSLGESGLFHQFIDSYIFGVLVVEDSCKAAGNKMKLCTHLTST